MVSGTQNPSSSSAQQGWPVCEQDQQAGCSARPSFEILLDSSGWELPGPFLPLPLSKPGSFGTAEVEREGGVCCPARIGSFPVVPIPKGITHPSPGDDASRGTAPADSVWRRVLLIWKTTKEL